VLTVIAVEGNKVRLGIDAPRSVRVDRKEIHDRRILEATNEPMLIIERECAVG
jgi:carbon storage regulator CsrA